MEGRETRSMAASMPRAEGGGDGGVVQHIAGEVLNQMRTEDHVCPVVLLVYTNDSNMQTQLTNTESGLRVEARIERGVRVYTVSHVAREPVRGTDAAGVAMSFDRARITFSLETRNRVTVLAHLMGIRDGCILASIALREGEEVTGEDVLVTASGASKAILGRYSTSAEGSADAALLALDYRPCKPTKRTQSEINAINRVRMLGPHREVAMGAL